MIKMKRKLMALAMTAALVTTLFAGLTISASAVTNYTATGTMTALWNNGSPTSASSGTYYSISSAAELGYFRDYVNAGKNTSGVTFFVPETVTAIALSGSWTPIGSVSITSDSGTSSPVATGTGFKGTFDGGGAIISNLSVTATGSGNGFFAYLAPGGTIRDFTISGNISASSSYDAIAGVVGYNCGLVEDVINQVTVNAPASYNVAGIAGFNDAYYVPGAYGTIRNSANEGIITGYSKVGGIAGENAGTIASCSNTSSDNTQNVIGKYDRKGGTGGIAGRNGNNNTAVEAGIITDCYNTAMVGSEDGSWNGGITGFQNSLSSCSYCYNAGYVTGYAYRDDTAGKNEGTITNCYALNTGLNTQHYDGTTLYSVIGSIASELTSHSSTLWATNSTTGYPYLKNEDTSLSASTSGHSGTPQTLETGIVLGGSGTYTDLTSAITAAQATTDRTVYVAGTTNLTTSYDGGSSKVTIKRSRTFTGTMFNVQSGASVTLSNLIFDGNTGNNISGQNVIYSKGNLTINSSVTFQNIRSQANGGAVHVAGGTTNSSATYTSCAARNGGAVYISGGTFTLSAGTISACSAAVNGDGIYVGETFELSGNYTIEDTIYLASGKYITLGSAIPSSGITVQAASPSNNLVIAQSDGSYTITTDDEDLVTSADEDYYVDLVNSILVLKEA